MPDVYAWSGEIDGDLENPGNYRAGSEWSGPPAATLPLAGDWVYYMTDGTNPIQSGRSYANWMTDVYVCANPSVTFDGSMGTIHLAGGSVVCNGPISGVASSGGTSVTLNYPATLYDGGWDLGRVILNAPATVMGWLGVTYVIANAPLTLGIGGYVEDYSRLIVNDTLCLNSGPLLYSPTSPSVAPANKVLAGVNNLGQIGTLNASSPRIIGGLGVA